MVNGFDFLPQSRDPIKAALGPTAGRGPTPRQQCLDTGGFWDEDTQTCLASKPSAVITEAREDTKQKFGGARETFAIGGKALTREEFDKARRAIGFQQRTGGLGAPEEETRELLKDIPGEQQIGLAAQAVEAERARLIAEETPVRRELEPELTGLERIPVVGGTIGALSNIFQRIAQELGLDEGSLQPEELRTMALSEIERQEVERGLSASETFGQLVEGIPVIGSLASKYAGGLIETPSENAREVKSNILKEKRRISNIETNVKLGYLPVSVAREQIEDIEENVQRLESRIRLLISNSPELKFNSDFVNTIETEILATREKGFQAKSNILTGATRDAAEIDLLLKLQSMEGEVEQT